ncbi:TetR/AcrR family transcriptional regulator [Fusibacter sp. JL298sf-3]
MPKDTFFNLPEEKQQLIMDAAISEFENNPYDQASINRIIAAAGIPKGSFYQYFSDKKDLYKHLIQGIVAEKLKYITPVMENPMAHPFFEVARAMNRSAIQFANDNPQFMRIGRFLLKDKTHPIYLEIIGENEAQAAHYYELLLTKAIERGEFRDNLNVKLTAHMLFSLSTQIVDYNGDILHPQWLENTFKALDELLDLFAYGMLKGQEATHPKGGCP